MSTIVESLEQLETTASVKHSGNRNVRPKEQRITVRASADGRRTRNVASATLKAQESTAAKKKGSAMRKIRDVAGGKRKGKLSLRAQRQPAAKKAKKFKTKDSESEEADSSSSEEENSEEMELGSEGDGSEQEDTSVHEPAEESEEEEPATMTTLTTNGGKIGVAVLDDDDSFEIDDSVSLSSVHTKEDDADAKGYYPKRGNIVHIPRRGNAALYIGRAFTVTKTTVKPMKFVVDAKMPLHGMIFSVVSSAQHPSELFFKIYDSVRYAVLPFS